VVEGVRFEAVFFVFTLIYIMYSKRRNNNKIAFFVRLSPALAPSLAQASPRLTAHSLCRSVDSDMSPLPDDDGCEDDDVSNHPVIILHFPYGRMFQCRRQRCGSIFLRCALFRTRTSSGQLRRPNSN